MRSRASCVAVFALFLAACAHASPPEATSAPHVATSLPADAIPAATVVPTVAPSAATEVPTATPSAATEVPHVFVIVMENTGLQRALGARPIGALAAKYAVATNYHAVGRPSLPNYLAMTSGSTHGITDDGYYALPAGDIGAQLTRSGISWRAYMEGMTAAGGCMRSPYPYALKHNPFAYYGGACPPNVVPLESLDADLAGPTAQFVWITPGLCHDGHDCSIDQAGAWLDSVVDRITASRAWSERGILFIAWDEGDGGDANLVPLIVATSRGMSGELTGAYDHYSLLATIEDLYRLPRLGAATSARSLLDVLGNN